MSSRIWLARAAAKLGAAGVDTPMREARLLLGHALGLTQTDLLRAGDRAVPPAADALLARRCAREPMALILGRQGFWTLDLAVSPATLIPRADSETLIEAAAAASPARGRVRRILDLGTGTGCLLLALLTEYPQAWGLGIDRVAGAAGLARDNARLAGLAERCAFIVGDWAGAIAGTFDLVVCNPPYIRRDDIDGLMPEVSRHEPASALDGGLDGLDAYRAVLPALRRLVVPGGAAVLELGAGQATEVATLAQAAGLDYVALRPDVSGTARALVLRNALL